MNLEYIPHKNIDRDSLLDIIKVKSFAWPFPVDKQLEWIEKNLKDDDIHVLLNNDENEFVAYLNLVKTSIKINDIDTPCLGIGNVCSSKKGRGYGLKIMNFVSEWITENNEIGLLFCKDSLVDYYVKFNWSVVSKESIYITELDNETNTMIYNFDEPIRGLSYEGKLF